MTDPAPGLSLRPMRGLRPTVDGEHLARVLCPPYDVITSEERSRLLAEDPDNAVAVVLPEAPPGTDPYQAAARLLAAWVADGRYAVDDAPTIYVYEMRDAAGVATRGLLGAVELRDPADGVILPHENTMSGPVADRLALMSATETNVEPIYLVYEGGGAASAAVREVDSQPPLAQARTADGISHRLWAITDPNVHQEIAEDLGARRAMIADGHHRYATYREFQRQRRAAEGPGPWDFGLTLLVDSSTYGPQVHAIHRVLIGQPFDAVVSALAEWADVTTVGDPAEGLAAAADEPGFAAVLTDGTQTVVLADRSGRLREATRRPGESDAFSDLDVVVVHRSVVETVLGLADDVDTVGYAHTVPEALAQARSSQGSALLLRPTPVAAVAAVAAAGGRMPRKSTLFTPKPASGLVMRRLADER